ncbi:hypothetical protein ACW73L_04560 [Methylolobus aquaticus]
MKTQRYDLLYFGVAEQEDARELAALGLARLLGIELPQAEAVLNRPNVILRQQLLEEEARALQAALFRIGIRSNYQPASRGTHQFELVPLEEEKARSETLVCPNCGTEITTEPGEALPEVCPSCDIVFAKYGQYTQEQKQRERLRQRLLSKMKAEEAEAREEAERIARQALARQVEDEVCRELGLPSVINSRARLAGAAGGLLLAGLLVGLGASQLAARFGDQGADAAEAFAAADTVAPAVGGGIPADPGMELVTAMQGDGAADPEVSLAAGAQGLPADPLAVIAMPLNGAKAVATDPALSDAAAAGTALPAQGGERVVAKPPRSALDPAVVRAAMIADASAATDPLEALGQLALHFLALRDASKAAAVAAEMQERAASGVTGLPAVNAAATLAYVRFVLGDRKGADEAFDRGLALAAQLPDAAGRGAGLAALAVQAARGLRPDDADALFRKANAEVLGLRNPADRLQAICALAERYALAGRRANALGALDHVARQLAALPNTDARANVGARLALAHAALDDFGAAWDAVRRLPAGPGRDAAVFALARTALNGDQLTWGAELVDRLMAPGYAAGGQAWLGLARTRVRLDGAAAFAQADARSREVADPAERAEVLGRLAAAQFLAGDRSRADGYVTDALRAAERIAAPDEKDRVLTAVVERLATAFMSDAAATVLSQIGGAGLRAAAERSVAASQRLAAIVLPRPVPGSPLRSR